MSLFSKRRASGPEGAAASPSAPARGFDVVHVPLEGGGLETMTKAQFDALPLEGRVKLLVRGTLRFYRAGVEIAGPEALRADY